MKRNWGFLTFALVSLIASLILVLAQEAPGHYRVFTGAAQALLQGDNPYESTFGTGVGYYFYSPSCALFFFSAFSLLPEKIGLALYMLLSWSVFAWGTRAFLKAFSGSDKLSGIWNWFWIVIASQMWGGILASKLEILMTGILLLSTAWIIRGRWTDASAVLLAMILNWKFQPLPTMGLLLLAFFLIRRNWRWPLTFLFSVLLWFRLPYYVMPSRGPLLDQAHATWTRTLSAFVEKAWIDFENIFAFLNHALGVSLTYRATQGISVAAGGALAAATAGWILARRGRLEGAELFRRAALLALALGAMFTVAFSPLGQNNALIVYTPLLLAAFVSFEESHGTWRELWRGAIIGTWAIMTLPYSDLIPEKTRDLFRYLALKPVGCVLLAILLGAWYFRMEYPRMPGAEHGQES